jgi:hypothetical protein
MGLTSCLYVMATASEIKRFNQSTWATKRLAKSSFVEWFHREVRGAQTKAFHSPLATLSSFCGESHP